MTGRRHDRQVGVELVDGRVVARTAVFIRPRNIPHAEGCLVASEWRLIEPWRVIPKEENVHDRRVQGGCEGSAGLGRVRMNPGYWLWPLPRAGSLRLFVEWPIVGIELSVVELSCALLLDAAARSEMLGADQP